MKTGDLALQATDLRCRRERVASVFAIRAKIDVVDGGDTIPLL